HLGARFLSAGPTERQEIRAESEIWALQRPGAPVPEARSTKMGLEKGALSGMWKATIRGLVARKVRLALSALAILLGVSFVSATYVLTDTVKRSFDAFVAQTLTNVDLQVQCASALGDRSNPGRIPDATVDDVRA